MYCPTRFLITLLISLTIIINGNISSIAANNLEDLKTGPFIDKLVIKNITDPEERFLALLNNDIDMIEGYLDPEYLPEIQAEINIGIIEKLRNGYGLITINTAKYPFNITAFRRAFAFAFDKYKVSNEILGGFSLPMDSPVPRANLFTIEEELPYHYYEAQVEIAKELLDKAGFIDVTDDGYREAPNGTQFGVNITAYEISDISIGVAEEGVRALDSIGVKSEVVEEDFYECLEILKSHQDYDMAFFVKELSDISIRDYLVNEFSSESADVYGVNFANFRNETYDSLIPILLSSSTYEETAEAYAQMQEILIYEQPIVICYNDIYLTVFRTDKFEGHVYDKRCGAYGPWTHRKVHLKLSEGGPYGGTFRIGTSNPIGSFNPYKATGYKLEIENEMHATLYSLNNNGVPIPYIADSYVVELHADNPDVPINHTRFTFDIIESATFTDKQPITAEDFVLTINFLKEALQHGCLGGLSTQNITQVFASTPYTLVVEFNTESFWNFYDIALLGVQPIHTFIEAGIEPANWMDWNPVVGDEETNPYVTSGPFIVNNHVPGDFTEFDANEDFVFYANRATETTSTTITTVSTIITTIATTNADWDTIEIISISVTIGSLGVIIVVTIMMVHAKRTGQWSR